MSDRSRRFYDQQLDLATPREWTDLVPRAILADIARAHGGDRAAGKATWLVCQLYDNHLLDLRVLLDRVRRNASEQDRRRNSQYFQAIPA